jgi:hypothetical protein
MLIHTCKKCDFHTEHKYLYDKHCLTIKHNKFINTNNCVLCNFKSIYKSVYNKHLLSKKHINNTKENEQLNINNNNNNVVMDKIDNLSKQNEELKEKIEQLERVNNQNTNKIVKEARAIKKSILTLLNANFKDTPSIAYINEEHFRLELEEEYKRKISDTNNELFIRIFNDYTNKKLIKTLADLILKFVKKQDQKTQSVFNIDSARGNFATKIEDLWLNDKSGLQLKKYTLDVIIEYLLKVLDIFGQRLTKMFKDKKKSSDKMDYIMTNQSMLFEVRSFLTNSNTHKKVILMLCPELRLDQRFLEAIEE